MWVRAWLPESCDTPALCLHCPRVPPLPGTPRSPRWGPYCRWPPCPSHGGITAGFLSPKHGSDNAPPSKENKPTLTSLNCFSVKAPLQAGKALRNLTSRTCLCISGAPSVQPAPHASPAGPRVLTAGGAGGRACVAESSLYLVPTGPRSECPRPSFCRSPADAGANNGRCRRL